MGGGTSTTEIFHRLLKKNTYKYVKYLLPTISVKVILSDEWKKARLMVSETILKMIVLLLMYVFFPIRIINDKKVLDAHEIKISHREL